MKITAVIIAKNEEEIIRTALESVKGFDEIIFVDTGSTDKTIDIAKEFTDKIFHFPWVDDFSAARNYAIEQATGDWIYSIDCDHKLISTADKVRDEAIKADQAGEKVALVLSLSSHGHEHWREVLFKNTPEVRWVGKVHECLSLATTYKSEVEREIGYSKNHHIDKDRNLRILLSVEEKTQRNKFYLGRENYERRKYDEAIEWMNEYLKEPKNISERAEALITIARCHWFSKRGDEARAVCLQAINVNPMCKEALLFMSSMLNEPHKSAWKKLSESADNSNVLFIRNK